MPSGLQEVGGPRISKQLAHESGKVVSPTHRPSLLPGKIPGTHFFYRLSQSQGHSETGRIKSLNPIGDRTRDVSACSAVPQPTAPPRTPISVVAFEMIRESE